MARIYLCGYTARKFVKCSVWPNSQNWTGFNFQFKAHIMRYYWGSYSDLSKTFNVIVLRFGWSLGLSQQLPKLTYDLIGIRLVMHTASSSEYWIPSTPVSHVRRKNRIANNYEYSHKEREKSNLFASFRNTWNGASLGSRKTSPGKRRQNFRKPGELTRTRMDFWNYFTEIMNSDEKFLKWQTSHSEITLNAERIRWNRVCFKARNGVV